VNEKEIRRWHHDHGVEYIPEDWTGRSETGETIARLPFWGDPRARENMARRANMTPGGMQALDDSGQAAPLYAGRTAEDREYVMALEDFFDPYIALLPRPKGNLIREYMGMRRTEADIARTAGVTQQAVSQALQRALRALTALVARDDPEWVPPADKRRRDYEGEREAAERVFDRYWQKRKARP
jgi:hypothetical protein